MIIVCHCGMPWALCVMHNPIARQCWHERRQVPLTAPLSSAGPEPKTVRHSWKDGHPLPQNMSEESWAVFRQIEKEKAQAALDRIATLKAKKQAKIAGWM